MKRLFLLGITGFMLLATPVMAKEGLYIGAYIVPTAKISGVSNLDTGSGYGFRAGVGFNRYFALESSIEMTDHDIGTSTVDVTGIAVDAKVNFPLTTLDSRNIMSLEPYIRLGFGVSELEFENGSSADGSGARFGFGIELYLFQELSVNAGWTNTSVSYDGSIGKDSDVRTFDIGLSYHFM